jgi:hypothetical protein
MRRSDQLIPFKTRNAPKNGISGTDDPTLICARKEHLANGEDFFRGFDGGWNGFDVTHVSSFFQGAFRQTSPARLRFGLARPGTRAQNGSNC